MTINYYAPIGDGTYWRNITDTNDTTYGQIAIIGGKRKLVVGDKIGELCLVDGKRRYWVEAEEIIPCYSGFYPYSFTILGREYHLISTSTSARTYQERYYAGCNSYCEPSPNREHFTSYAVLSATTIRCTMQYWKNCVLYQAGVYWNIACVDGKYVISGSEMNANELISPYQSPSTERSATVGFSGSVTAYYRVAGTTMSWSYTSNSCPSPSCMTRSGNVYLRQPDGTAVLTVVNETLPCSNPGGSLF